jgi:hypothetical protein
MKYGLSLPAFGEHSDVRTLAHLAREAEHAGWDGFFVWDHMVFDPSFHPMADPWVALAAIAMQTERIRLGTMLTPLARRRPWKVVRETVSLDRLCNGRLVLGVGLGDPARWEFGYFGEPTDARVRAEMLDEGLDILNGLWSGERFSFHGKHYRVDEVVFRPRPAQHPRIPIWVGGWWPNKPPFRRAARWDGVIPLKREGTLSVAQWRDILAYIQQQRTAKTPFDAVHSGLTSGDDPAKAAGIVAPYAEAGVTWWVETVDPWQFGWKWDEPLTPEASKPIRRRIMQGPPRI